MRITVLGGSGFIGLAICESLVKEGHAVVSISRQGKPKHVTDLWANKMTWVQSDILADTNWKNEVIKADWVIHTVGILFENKQRGHTYEKFIIRPVAHVLSAIEKKQNKPRLMFISANQAPFFLQGYLAAKKAAELLIQNSDSKEHIILYPSMVMGKGRPLASLSGSLIKFLKKIPGVKSQLISYQPMLKEELANEVVKILGGGPSLYTSRRGK